MLQNYALLAGLLAGSITDLRTREVPDWINYSLMGAGIGLNALASIIMRDYRIMLYSIAGLAIFLALSHLMYYTGQWGGGDAKMLMGIGALLGLPVSLSFPFFDVNAMLISFLMNLLIAGFAYGVGAALFIAFANRKKFTRQLGKELEAHRVMRLSLLAASGGVLLISFFMAEPPVKLVLAAAGTITAGSFYLWIFVRAVENACMYRLVRPEQLTEGDWIARDIIVGKKRITGPKDLGIEKKQIRELIRLQKKGKIKRIMIKEGIPFVPSFLLAFLMTLVWGNVMLMLI